MRVAAHPFVCRVRPGATANFRKDDDDSVKSSLKSRFFAFLGGAALLVVFAVTAGYFGHHIDR